MNTKPSESFAWRTMPHEEFRGLLVELVSLIRDAEKEKFVIRRSAAAVRRNASNRYRNADIRERELSDERERALRAKEAGNPLYFARRKFPNHGMRERYMHRVLKCRCGECRAANNAYHNDHRQTKRT